MEYDIDKEFNKNLSAIKKYKNACFPFAWALRDFMEKCKGIEEKSLNQFKKFQETAKYKQLLLASIKRFRELNEKTNEIVKKYGYYSSKAYEDEEVHKDYKGWLRNMEKEAKRLKLKIS